MIPDRTTRIVGGSESQVFVGVGPHTILGEMRGFAITVRTQGTIIAWIIGQDQGGPAMAYAPTWITIALNQGDYFVSRKPILQFQMTAATDSITVHCDRSY